MEFWKSFGLALGGGTPEGAEVLGGGAPGSPKGGKSPPPVDVGGKSDPLPGGPLGRPEDIGGKGWSMFGGGGPPANYIIVCLKATLYYVNKSTKKDRFAELALHSERVK